MRVGSSVTRGLATAIAVLLGLAFAVPAAAQSFGVKAGINLSKATGTAEVLDGARVGFKSGSGFVGGAYARFARPLSSFAVQVEANYLRRNGGLDLSAIADEVGDAAFEIKADYLEIPLLLKLYPSPRGGVRFNVYAGGAVAFRLSASTVERLFGTVTETDIKKETRAVDFGVPLGVGIELGPGLDIDARYTIGLTRVDSEDAGLDAKWRTWSFTLGYTF